MPRPVEFQEELAEILDEGRPLSFRRLERLSNLSREEMSSFRKAWAAASSERRQQVIRALLQLTEENIDLNFRDVLLSCTTDGEEQMRAAAIEGLWDDESCALLERLLVIATEDPSPQVRSQALLTLSRFTYLIEITDRWEEYRDRVHEVLLGVWNEAATPLEVRRRAVEALGYLSEAPGVEEAIAQAYSAPEREMRASAIHAMGHHMAERWQPAIERELASSDPEMRFEAAQAGGEMANPLLVPHLAPLLEDEDHEVARVAIWALGETGGVEARRLLEQCLASEEEDIREAAEDALFALGFFEDPLRLV